MVWYKQTVEELFNDLESSNEGLSTREVNKRLSKYGPNQLATRKESIWKIIIEPFKSVFVAVLVVAAIVSVLSGEMLEAAIVGAIIMINTIIFYTQQYATTRVLRNLKKHRVQKVMVTRGGDRLTVLSTNLVPGDIVHLTEGERIPADARLLDVDGLQIDESSLTGESVSIQKHASTLEITKPIYEQENMVFQGTYVIAGIATAIVVETGTRTEFGKITQLATGDNAKSPVQQKIDNLITTMIKFIAVILVIVFALALLRGMPFNEALRFVLSMSVAAVPEGLPVALTVIIVLGMRRMAKRHVLVRSFRAIEDIGLLTAIATDKTGTLTLNHLSVVDNWSLEGESVPAIALRTLDLRSNHSDPLDKAIVEKFGGKHLPKIDKIYPFDLGSRMSGAYIESQKVVYIKGSPEHMLAKSSITKSQRHEAESSMHELASKGYRVIAIGRLKVRSQPPVNLKVIKSGTIDLVGFLAFADELRSEALGAINKAKLAGISVRLITGDHYETAYNIGKKLGLADSTSQVIRGEELPSDIKSLAVTIRDKTVFARILPADKFRILKALKRSEITAMTGDGVNDVPALANAHVGIAMGSGSDIARDAGGIVLMNNNFASIIDAIAEGRRIFDNIRRILFYLLATTLGEILTMVGALVVGLPLPVTAIQILWINLVTDTALVLPLGMEPAEEGHMRRPPRRPKDPLLSRILIFRLILVGSTMAIVTLVLVYILSNEGRSIGYIQTVAMTALVVAQWVNAFNARSEVKSSFSRLKQPNYGLLVGFIIALILQLLVLFGPLSTIFNTQEVHLGMLVFAGSLAGISVLVVSELHKWFVRATYRS